MGLSLAPWGYTNEHIAVSYSVEGDGGGPTHLQLHLAFFTRPSTPVPAAALTGTIPDILSTFSRLSLVDLSENNLDGQLPLLCSQVG